MDDNAKWRLDFLRKENLCLTLALILALALVMANSIFTNQVCDRITVGVKDSVGDSFPSPAAWSKLGEVLRLPASPEIV
ncbi:MAG: hypothetical protein ABSF10_16790 [Verrucomicrobiota bacterium]|jgi:hypothetical protein